MTMESPRLRMRPRMYVWAASLALVASGVTLVSNYRAHEVGPRAADAAAISTKLTAYSLKPSNLDRDVVTTASKSRTILYVKRSVPIHLSIPVIGVSAPLVILGLNKDGSPQVPSSWYVPGWYKYDASPGQYGTAV